MTEPVSRIDELLCDLADALMEYHNPCEKTGARCLVGSGHPCCTQGTRFGPVCPHLQNGVCQFRNAECHLWFCETVLKHMDPKTLETFKLLEQIAVLYGLTQFPLLGDPYDGVDHPPQTA